MGLFIIYNLTLLSSVFSIGVVLTLLLQYKSKTSKNILLFLCSLFLITSSFYLNVLTPVLIEPNLENIRIIRHIIHLSGAGINIWILPYLMTSLTNNFLSNRLKRIYGLWAGLFILLASMSFFIINSVIITTVISLMQLLSIAISIIYLGLSIKRVKTIWWYKSLRIFLLISIIFLLTLILDMAITIFKIQIFTFFENKSLPIYLLFINIGVALFSVKFLSKTVMMDNGELTSSCVEYYKLSPREIEVIEALYIGGTNKEIGEKLFISSKTVENHLTTIYKKIKVKSRTELIQAINNWSPI